MSTGQSRSTSRLASWRMRRVVHNVPFETRGSGMRTSLKTLYWIAVAALAVFGFRTLIPNERVVSDQIKEIAPWVTSNILAFTLIFAAGLAAGAGAWAEIASWLAARRASPQATWPLRQFVRYLATEADVAYEFDDYRVWDRELESRIVDDFANETRPLAVWGRASRSGKETGDLGPMELLKPAYWSTNRLDWHSCLASDYPWTAHTWGMFSESPRYDLHVDRSQATQRYPKAPLLLRLVRKSPVAERPPQKIIERENDELHIWESLDGRSTSTLVKAKKPTNIAERQSDVTRQIPQP